MGSDNNDVVIRFLLDGDIMNENKLSFFKEFYTREEMKKFIEYVKVSEKACEDDGRDNMVVVKMLEDLLLDM